MEEADRERAVHIWEYEGLPGFESTKAAVRASKVRSAPPLRPPSS